MRRLFRLLFLATCAIAVPAAALASSEDSPEAGTPAPVSPDGPGSPGGPSQRVTPAPAPGIDFTGVWQTSVSSGIGFRMTLLQDAAGSVIGHFTPPNGVVFDGAVVGNRLFADWSQAGIIGRFAFTMAAGGNTFTGFFTTGDRLLPLEVAEAEGAWHGTREVAALPAGGPEAMPLIAEGVGSRVTSFATLTTNANIRSGPARNTRSLGTLPDGATVPVIRCADRWCEVSVPGFAMAYIAQSLLRMNARPPRESAPPSPAPSPAASPRPIPAPPIPPAIPAPIPPFAGVWATVTDAGERLEMVLEQSETSVTGRYSPGNGAIEGAIAPDGRLVYRWSEADGSVGMGVFDLSRDGRTMAGTFNSSADPLALAGSWFGTRLARTP